MAEPDIIPQLSENAIASYNYFDVAEGTGIIVFNGYSHKEQTTLGYGLTVNSLFSNNCYTSAATSSGTKVIDADFDIIFNMPQRIKGKIKVNLTLGGGPPNAASSGCDVYAILKVRKWDGSAETEIANAQSATLTSLGNTIGNIDYGTVCFEVNVAAIQDFKKGDKLRLTVEVYGAKTGTNESIVYLLHDPKDRVDTVSVPTGAAGGVRPLTSQLLTHIPFVLNL